MKINAAWEIKTKSKAICRWIVAWDDVKKDEIAGAVAGYAGGGGFVVERFYGKLKGGKLTALWIDFTDTISGNEIEFDDCGDQALAVAEAGLDAIWEWNDNDAWSDTDEVILLNSKSSDLKKVKDMLHLGEESLPCLQMICEKAGLTAAPSK
jgi:hypothetical protein